MGLASFQDWLVTPVFLTVKPQHNIFQFRDRISKTQNTARCLPSIVKSLSMESMCRSILIFDIDCDHVLHESCSFFVPMFQSSLTGTWRAVLYMPLFSTFLHSPKWHFFVHCVESVEMLLFGLGEFSSGWYQCRRMPQIPRYYGERETICFASVVVY